MKLLSVLIIVIVFIFSLCFALVLAIANPDQATLLIGFSEVETTNGQLIVYAFACGISIGLMAMLISVLFDQVRVGYLQYRLEKLQSELDSIKSNGLRESI